MEDPELRKSPLIGFRYPDLLQDKAPMAWKCWAESLFDAPLTMHYPNLDRRMRYRLRVVHSGDAPHMKIRLMANDSIEIHPYMLRVWPPAPREFSIPPEATANGELKRHGRANRAWEATGAVARWPKFGLFQPPQRSLHNGVVARIGSKLATLGEITERLPHQCRISTTPRGDITSPR